ncbi:MAG: DUF5908 family protein [Methylobacter sp.]|jgi:hypothetical protein|nr:DUF5908 family protein [Methylobacter sp.]
MPVEIRELVIRAVVKDERNQNPDTAAMPEELQNQQALIEECVKQVLKILKRKQER